VGADVVVKYPYILATVVGLAVGLGVVILCLLPGWLPY